MITALLTILNTVVGALWRRWLGGWRPFGWDAWGGRLLKHTLMAVLSWPLFLVLPWWGALAAIGGAFVFMNVRHDNGGPGWRPLWRYGPFGIGYMVARKYIDRLPWTGKERALVEPWCWTCYGELWLGGTFFGTLALICLLLV